MMAATSKIEQYNLHDEVMKKRMEGLGTQAIAKYLRDKYNVEISFMAIQRHLDKSQKNMIDSAATDMNESKKSLKEWKIVTKQIKKLNVEAWKMFSELKKSKTIDARAIGIMNQIQKQLEFMNKLFGGVVQRPDTMIIENKTQIINMTNDINEVIEELERRGYIVGTQYTVIQQLKQKGYKVTFPNPKK